MTSMRLATLMLLFVASKAFSHTYLQVGVNSNFLVDEGKVYFAQSDRTMAVLDLETGAVIARKRNIDYSGTLYRASDMRNSIDDVSPFREGRGRVVSSGISEDYMNIVEVTKYDGDNATVVVTFTADYNYRSDPNLKHKVEVAYRSEKNHWSGHLPYLMSPGKVVAVEHTENLILLGTNLGHVEAVDRATGQSLWMYIFPTMRYTVTASARGRPPMMATAAKIFKEENRHTKPESGLVLYGVDIPSNPNIIFDPKPFNPYRRLYFFIILSWIGILIPIVFTGIIVRSAMKRNWNAREPAVLSLFSVFAAVIIYLFLGYVSQTTAYGLIASIMVPLIAAIVFSFRAMFLRQLICGVVVLLLALAVAYIMYLGLCS